ncbi:MAG TPA: hypothetical protein VIZ43_07050 [Trebonia sp.]
MSMPSLQSLQSLQSLASLPSLSSVRRRTAAFARKRSRLSVVAAATATAGVLGTAGFVAGTAPWAQAVGDAATAAPGVSLLTSGQPSASSLFHAVTSGTARSQLDVNRATIASGNSGAAEKPPAQHRPAAASAHAAKPAAKPVQRKVVQRPAAKRQAVKPKPARPSQQYSIYDSVKPSTIPSGEDAAVYANGNYAAFPSQLKGHSILWIDTNGSDPSANALDVEPGDATPAGAEQWVKQRLSSKQNGTAIVYTMLSDWPQVKQDIGHLPSWMQSKVRYWIADPTGNPHVVPGASATQWYWGSKYDITTANPNF